MILEYRPGSAHWTAILKAMDKKLSAEQFAAWVIKNSEDKAERQHAILEACARIVDMPPSEFASTIMIQYARKIADNKGKKFNVYLLSEKQLEIIAVAICYRNQSRQPSQVLGAV